MTKEKREDKFIEKKILELVKHMRNWSIIEPELTLVAGNVRRICHEIIKVVEKNKK